MGHPTAIFLTPPDPNYKCGICLDIFDDPVSLLRCGHTFCRSCLHSSLEQSGKKCPECRAIIDTEEDVEESMELEVELEGGGNVIHGVRVIGNAIGSLRVRCRNGCLDENGELLKENADANGNDNDGNDESGGDNEVDDDEQQHQQGCSCNWTGPLSSWPLHSSTSCPVATLTCPVPGCSHTCPRHLMKSHVGSPQCVKAAVVSQVETQMNGVLSDLRKRMKQEVERKVKELKDEKTELEDRVEREMERRILLEEQNDMLRKAVKVLKREVRSHVERARQRDTSGQSDETATVAAASASSLQDGTKRKKKKKRSRDNVSATASFAVSVSPTSSMDGTYSASSSVDVDGRKKKRSKSKKKRSKRQHQQQEEEQDAGGSGRMRAVSTDADEGRSLV